MSSGSLENAETIAASPEQMRAITDGVSISLPDDGKQSGSRSSGAIRAAAQGFVNLVEGSTPHLSGETQAVLQSRLRLAAILFFAAFAAFWVRGLIFEDPHYVFATQAHADRVAAEQYALRWVHFGVTLLMGGIAVWLSRLARATLTTLRLVEYTVFGGVALFFVLVTYMRFEIEPWLASGDHLPAVVAPWMLLLFTYALFIPNSWRRSLRFLVPATVLPVGLMLLQGQYCSEFQECMSRKINANYLSTQTLLLLVSFATAVIGVHTINTLRTQAFAAKQLGQYRLKRKLGAGGMGEVYLGEHQMMKRPCAIKVIRPEKAGDPKTLARFEREVRSTAKLSHWNSIDIYDYGNSEDGTFYYVMEYLPGHNTGELVEQSGPLPTERVVYLMEQVCRALSEAHGIGLVHRDIKPANIFCSYRGGEFDVAKLLDFGLAKPVVDSTLTGDGADLTAEGAITGSPMFMSPEQASGVSEADARSDIYSLGCVIYYLVTGKAPFPYPHAVKVIIAHASESVVPPREHRAEVPVELEEVILRCLEKDPEDRFQTAEQLRQALLEVPAESAWSADRASDWWNCNGCPKRKAMAAEAIEAAAV